MVKAFLFGFLSATIILGIVWFTVGRTSIADIRATVDRTNLDLERVERVSTEFGDDFERYTGEFPVRIVEANTVRDQIGELREEFGGYAPEVRGIKSELESISDAIDDVEGSVSKSINIGRDFADILYEYRRLSETGREEE